MKTLRLSEMPAETIHANIRIFEGRLMPSATSEEVYTVMQRMCDRWRAELRRRTRPTVVERVCRRLTWATMDEACEDVPLAFYKKFFRRLGL